jgi:hypothetical protein
MMIWTRSWNLQPLCALTTISNQTTSRQTGPGETKYVGPIEGVKTAQEHHNSQLQRLGKEHEASTARVAGVEGEIAGLKEKTDKIGMA